MIDNFLKGTKNWKDVTKKLLIYELFMVGVLFVYSLIFGLFLVMTHSLTNYQRFIPIFSLIYVVGQTYFAYRFGVGIARGSLIKKSEIFKNVALVYLSIVGVLTIVFWGGKVLNYTHLLTFIASLGAAILGSKQLNIHVTEVKKKK